MKKVHSFQKKRPHLLPPLTNPQLSSPGPRKSLQAPDLLLSENRLGSPTPRSCEHETCGLDYIYNENNENPLITISREKESQKHNFMKFDLLSDSVFSKADKSFHQTQNGNLSSMQDSECGRDKNENIMLGNLCKKQLGKLGDLNKNLKAQSILPLQASETKGTSELNFLQLPNRYALLKPIGEGILEN